MAVRVCVARVFDAVLIEELDEPEELDELEELELPEPVLELVALLAVSEETVMVGTVTVAVAVPEAVFVAVLFDAVVLEELEELDELELEEPELELVLLADVPLLPVVPEEAVELELELFEL